MSFKSFIALSIIAIASAAAKADVDLSTYTFEKFLAEYDIRFHSSEIDTRRQIFETELARVRAHNAKNLSWKEGVSKFSAMTAAEKKGYMGRSKSAAATKDLKYARSLPADFKVKPINQLPASVDWRNSAIASPVKDQGQCGSCWAFASTATIESHVALSTGLLFDFSTEQIAMCAPNVNNCGGTGGCGGSTAELAYEYLSGSAGIFEEYQYPYTSYYGVNYDCTIPTSTKPKATINGYVQLPINDVDALMNAVATVGPVSISVDASTWSAYTSGVFNGCDQANPDVNHVVVLMGYGTENGQDYWLVRNSWSPTWGEAGYIKLARFNQQETPCGTDLTPQDGSACDGDDQPVKVCGTCGMLYDSSYPLNAELA